MKPKILLKPDRGGLELGAVNEQALVRNRNGKDEVSAVAGEIRSASKNGVGLATPLFGLNKILVPIDFSNVSEKLLRHSVQFVQPKAGRIILLHIVERRRRRERQARFGLTNGNRIDDAETKLLTLAERELGPTVKFEILVQSGTPYREVVNVAKALSVDLIVMGTRGLSTLQGLLLGSVSHKVMRHATCPVMLTR